MSKMNTYKISIVELVIQLKNYSLSKTGNYIPVTGIGFSAISASTEL